MITADELESIGFKHIGKYVWRISNDVASVSFDLAELTQNVRVETSDNDDMLLYNTIYFTIHNIKELRQFCFSLLRGNKYIQQIDMSGKTFAKYLILTHNFIIDYLGDDEGFIWCNQERNSFSWYMNNNNTIIVPTVDLSTCFMFKTKKDAEQDLILCSKLMEK